MHLARVSDLREIEPGRQERLPRFRQERRRHIAKRPRSRKMPRGRRMPKPKRLQPENVKYSAGPPEANV